MHKLPRVHDVLRANKRMALNAVAIRKEDVDHI